MRLNAKQIALYTGGEILVDPIGSCELMHDISWDSRTVDPGCLYVALPGERVDGHDFVAAALHAGAHGALVMRRPDEATCLLAREMGACIIEVANTYAAVTDLAREWRSHLKGVVIGVTGSTGKTTTKNLLRDVASAKFSVVATIANQNNELGVPRTILAANPETEVVIVEMGMRGLGQIRELCEFVRPDWGVITNIGEAHVELLGNRDNIARAKGELFEALPSGTGKAFMWAGDARCGLVLENSVGERAVKVALYGGSLESEPLDAQNLSCALRVGARDVAMDEEGRPHFRAFARRGGHGMEETAACQLALRGLHNVENACAAIAVGCSLGMSLEEAAQAVGTSLPESGRQELLLARAGYTIINDAYNANPDSMRAALSTLCSLEVKGRRFAVLGDMGELGDYAIACHEGVGSTVASLPIDYLICVGELSRSIADAAVEAGMDASRVMRASTIAEVLGELDTMLEPQDAVLVKASHSMGLNRVAEGLVS